MPLPTHNRVTRGGNQTLNSKVGLLKPYYCPSTENNAPEMCWEVKHLLQLLPAEIWVKVADQIAIKSTHSDKNYLQDFINSALYFRNLLLDKRVSFLFPDVVSILKRTNLDEDFGRDLLKSRAVCKPWNKSILEYYRFHPSRSNLLISTAGNTEVCDDLATVAFTSQASLTAYKIAILQREVENEGKPFNPLPFGYLRIVLIGDYIAETLSEDPVHIAYIFNLLNDICGTLLHMGEHVWYCKIVLPWSSSRTGPLISLFYATIRHWLRSMKNLKTLDISYKVMDNSLPPQGSQLDLLRTTILSSPIPTLAKLQCLKVTNLPDILFTEFVRANGHVKNFHVVGVQPGYTLGRSGRPGCELEELQIKMR